MAWEWSHSAEAYQAVRDNIAAQERNWLEIVWAEWEASGPDNESWPQFNERKYDAALKRAKKLPGDVLADAIYDKAEEHATCTNGGHLAHCCPFGCTCHMVSV